jgi:hypothetical protein
VSTFIPPNYIPKGVTGKTMIGTHLKSWISSGHVLAEAGTIRAAFPHLNLPSTPLMQKLSANNLHRGIDSLLTPGPADESYRLIQYGNLTIEQRASWLDKLRALHAEFLTDVCIDEPGRTPHVLILGLGRWKAMKG